MKLTTNLKINIKEFTSGLEAELSKVLSFTAAEATNKAREIAGRKLGKSGREHWNRGFKSFKVNNEMHIIAIEGKLASWMEDGIKTGEISQAILQGNRAKYNKAEGKNYVDVPFFKDADSVGNIRGTGVNVRAFADADSMIKSVKISDYKNKSVKEEKRVLSRVEDIIKSVDPERNNNTQYLTIRRVSPNSSPWPKTPFPGAKAIFKGNSVSEELDNFIDKKFEEYLERVL